NDYAFPYQLNKKQLNQFKYNITISNGYSSLLYNSGNGKMVLVVKAVNNWLFAATLFAYLFAILLAFIFLLHSLSFVFSFNWLSKSFKINWFPTIRTQIHATILFISLFSFIVIGVATVSFFYNRFNNSSQEKLSKIIQMVANEVQVQTKEIQTALSFDDGLTITDVPYLNALETKISEISELHHVDINLYSPAGNLLSSTQPFIYYKNLLSEKMNPLAFIELSSGKANNFVHTEHIGSLQYLSMYMPILDNSGAIFTYLNIPYLNSQAELNQEISGFLATLINLNAFIFLLAAAIAFIITNRIVDSFTVIANKMKEVNIGSKIEPLVWNKNDEIGLLVNEYNIMVEKLALSAESLAKSEREGAWREMARQVAHEIKKPLT
ncbi:MAG: HAMP domain-containing protein, partial [Chitinophagaceae bacterium]